MATPSYVPILKGKEGEFAALESLSNDVSKSIMPLIEVPGIPYDFSKERPSRTLEDHVVAVVERIKRCWPDRPIFVDLPWIEVDERLPDGRDPIEVMLANCKRLEISAVPVVSRDTSELALLSTGRYAEETRLGCAVRLVVEDFEEDTDLEQEVSRIFESIGRVDARSADLILDLEDVGADASRILLVTRSIFSMLPKKDEWRRLILSAASFPEDLSEVDASTISKLPRREWQLWKTLHRRPGFLPRLDIIYSDYGIAQYPSEQRILLFGLV